MKRKNLNASRTVEMRMKPGLFGNKVHSPSSTLGSLSMGGGAEWVGEGNSIFDIKMYGTESMEQTGHGGGHGGVGEEHYTWTLFLLILLIPRTPFSNMASSPKFSKDKGQAIKKAALRQQKRNNPYEVVKLLKLKAKHVEEFLLWQNGI